MQSLWVRKMVASMWLVGLLVAGGPAAAAPLPETIEQVKRGVVGVGTWQETRQPRAKLSGTGFVVGDGRHVITNDHVLPELLESESLEFIALFLPGDSARTEVRRARPVAVDGARDLVLLRMEGSPLPALSLGDSATVREGQQIAFTGFPIGAVLGLFPATHQGMVAAIAPVSLPPRSGRELDPALIRRLREPYMILQLDATAYPGNSGSPLYAPESGRVLGVVSMVFVKEGREHALERPSGISYAIPVDYVRALLRERGLE